jgi:hypothetical protein
MRRSNPQNAVVLKKHMMTGKIQKVDTGNSAPS